MVSLSKIKEINSLKYKKYRQKHRLYVSEGAKIVKELITSKHDVVKIYANEKWYNENNNLIVNFDVELIDDTTLKRISFLKSPNQVLALVKIPEKSENAETEIKKKQPILILDRISDPGNMGTILRIADWYNITSLLCYNNCVDIYNPLVVQASMGSIFHVNFLQFQEPLNMSILNNRQTVATCMGGTTDWDKKINANPVFIIGNESKGLSESIKSNATIKATIKAYGKAESLNAAIATAIVLDRYRTLYEKTNV